MTMGHARPPRRVSLRLSAQTDVSARASDAFTKDYAPSGAWLADAAFRSCRRSAYHSLDKVRHSQRFVDELGRCGYDEGQEIDRGQRTGEGANPGAMQSAFPTPNSPQRCSKRHCPISAVGIEFVRSLALRKPPSRHPNLRLPPTWPCRPRQSTCC
jgi:hypothetical protein